MGILKSDEFRGVLFDREIVCKECMTDKHWDKVTEDRIIFDEDIKKAADLYFCDHCGKRL